MDYDLYYRLFDFAAEHSLALPIYPELTGEQIEYVVDKINNFINF